MNIVRLNGGSSPGPGNIEFSLEEYTANENGGPAFVLMSRTDGALGQASAYVSLSDSAATAGSDYVNAISTPVWPSSIGVTGGSLFDRNISAAFMGPNNGSTNLSATVGGALLQNRVTVSVLDDLLVEGNESLNLRLTLPPFGDPNAPVIDLGGEPVPTGLALGRDTAVMVIADNDFAFGQLGFSANSYTVLENAKNATITITRTNGATGTVGIGYRATPGTATSTNFSPVTGTLTFLPGELSKSFAVPVLDNVTAGPNVTVNLELFEPIGGATTNGTTVAAILTIQDNEPGVDTPAGSVNNGFGGETGPDERVLSVVHVSSITNTHPASATERSLAHWW